jgi:hypothetical protein
MIQRPPTVLCSLLRDNTAGDNLVGGYPTCRARPGCLVAVNLVKQIRRKAFRMVALARFGRGGAVRVAYSTHGHHLRKVRDWLTATMAQRRIVFHTDGDSTT